MPHRLRMIAAALGGFVTIAAVVVGAFALSDRVTDEALERVPLLRGTSTPVATSTRSAAIATPSGPPRRRLMS